ncbi:hypothetical protein [Mangrovibacter plantisponsor]|uniref:Uncharacterized protein n=1 Tax=Mangrovibacter plantisponsor TaxID=451513 RepID=A0A317Q3H5_9ENTR|nr:hypothetical protein [Mangrovibacter plantisponsor]PWW10708.1 hypothetical protein DES37_10383 [Mangrovibacter plantisponsor]
MSYIFGCTADILPNTAEIAPGRCLVVEYDCYLHLKLAFRAINRITDEFDDP